ncbi:hypothetical protein MMC08_005579 [Hypocenomyce scalaris]|nr:hypothetical protein [Hypocenomyce scalaris]
MQQDAELRWLPPLQVAAVEAVSAEAEARLQSQAQVHDTAVEQLQQERKREKEVCDEKLQEQQDAELRLLPPLQVAAFDALSAENKARLKSQATLHCEAIEHLQQQHEREKQADRENLQQQVNELIRLRGEVKRLNNVVLTNSARSGEFLEPQLYTAPIRTRVLCGNPRICWHVFSASFLVEQAQFVHVVTCACATARSQSGKKHADPAPTARALQAAAKAGQAITASEATEPCPVGAVVPARQPSCKPSSGSQMACDPCAATTPLQELTNGSSPISFKVASPMKPRARPIPATHKVSGVAIAAKVSGVAIAAKVSGVAIAAKAEGVAADRKLTKPAADPSSVSVKENKSLMSVAGTPNQIKGSSSRAQPLSHEEEKAPTGTSSSQPAACPSACQERSSQAGSAGCKEVSSMGVSPPSLQAGVLRAAVVPLPVAAEGQLVDQPKAASPPLRAATPTPQERPPVSASVSIPDGLRNRPTPTTIAVQPSSGQALIDDLSSRMAGLRPVEGEAVVTMTSEPALSLASSTGASPIRRLPLPGTTVPQLSPVLLPFLGLPIAADLAEVTEATQPSTPSDHTMQANKHAVAAWADGTVTASAATDTAEASFADLLLSAALHEDMGTPGCVSPILGVIEQQRSEPTPLAEAQTDAATPASPSAASDASSTELCAELDAELDAGLEDDSSISSMDFGEAADAPHGERDNDSWACSGSSVSSLDFGYATHAEPDADSESSLDSSVSSLDFGYATHAEPGADSESSSDSSVSSLDFGYATHAEPDADSESSSDSSVSSLDCGGSCGQSHWATPLSFGSCGSLLD